MSKIETLCVQGGWQPKNGEPRVLPIYQSTTFKYESSNAMADLFDLKASGYFYTRLQNPTNDAVASKIAAMEGGVAAMLTSSGQAANRRYEQPLQRYHEEARYRMHVRGPGCERRGNREGLPPEHQVLLWRDGCKSGRQDFGPQALCRHRPQARRADDCR